MNTQDFSNGKNNIVPMTSRISDKTNAKNVAKVLGEMYVAMGNVIISARGSDNGREKYLAPSESQWMKIFKDMEYAVNEQNRTQTVKNDYITYWVRNHKGDKVDLSEFSDVLRNIQTSLKFGYEKASPTTYRSSLEVSWIWIQTAYKMWNETIPGQGGENVNN